MPLCSTSRSALFLLSLLFSLLSPSSALHDGGFVWSASASAIPGAITDYAALNGPNAHMFDYQIYVLYKHASTTAVMYTTYDWDDERVWTTPAAIDNAASYGGGAVTEYYRQPVAVWSDATTSTLTFSIQDTSTGVWGDQMASTYLAQQSPPNLFTPYSAEMFVFFRGTTSAVYGNCSYDGYSIFDDFPSPSYAHNHGSSAINNVDSNTYIFYSGAGSDGTPDGYLHMMWQDQNSGYWSPDITTRFPVDTDSTISAVPWSNNTDTYIFVFYKYQNNLVYVSYNHNAGGYFLPTGTSGYPLGLSSDSGPSAVVYYDPFYDTQVVSLFFAAYRASSNDFRVYNALGIPDNWP